MWKSRKERTKILWRWQISVNKYSIRRNNRPTGCTGPGHLKYSDRKRFSFYSRTYLEVTKHIMHCVFKALPSFKQNWSVFWKEGDLFGLTAAEIYCKCGGFLLCIARSFATSFRRCSGSKIMFWTGYRSKIGNFFFYTMRTWCGYKSKLFNSLKVRHLAFIAKFNKFWIQRRI